MNNQIKILNCPNCGAGLINVHEHIVKCSYCGGNVLLEFNKDKKQYEVSRGGNYGYYTTFVSNTQYYSSYPINRNDPIERTEPEKEPKLNMPLFAAGLAAIGVPIIKYD